MSYQSKMLCELQKMNATLIGLSLGAQFGVGSPENVIDSRKIGDFYVDTASGILYTNPNASGNTGREIVQTMPA